MLSFRIRSLSSYNSQKTDIVKNLEIFSVPKLRPNAQKSTQIAHKKEHRNFEICEDHHEGHLKITGSHGEENDEDTDAGSPHSEELNGLHLDTSEEEVEVDSHIELVHTHPISIPNHIKVCNKIKSCSPKIHLTTVLHC